MVFSSLVFLFIFLPLVIFFYFYSKNIKIKNIILFIFSLIFYAWGEPVYVFLMLTSITVNYFGARLIDQNEGKKRKAYFISLLALNLMSLGYFKYINFFIENLNSLSKFINISYVEVILPIGISFYTFQILSYVIDLYRKKVNVQKNILNLGLYIALFPQLVAGPIVRYETIEKQLSDRKETLDGFIIGLKRFIYGLGKKVIIANNVAIMADTIYNSGVTSYGTSILWLAAIAYTIQIYFDFSGYSDMAIGMGRMFGFTFLENFNYPYISKSITEFWRRWHMSLSSWFRDYVYIPLGGNRVSKIKWLRNIFIVWLLTGFWHGASWNYVLWGLYFAIILLVEKFFVLKRTEKLNILPRIYAVLLFVIGWVIFRLEDFSEMLYALKTMFIFKQSNLLLYLVENGDVLFGVPFIILGIIGSTPIFKKLFEKSNSSNAWLAIEYLFLIIVFALSVMSLISVKYNPFIYFKF